MSVVSEFERHVQLDGCFNFRELGGYRTTDGHWTRPERLYRADGPHALTELDGGRLLRLGLATVIDLRTSTEVERGCYTSHLSDVIEYHLPMMDLVPEADEVARWTDPVIVARRYRSLLDEAAGTIRDILAILSEPSAYPAMFHCSAGKDRTGVIAAIMLGIAGVPDETIVADYALSEAPMRRLVDYYQTSYPDAADLLTRLAPAMIAAYPQTMAHLIESIRTDFGDFDAYAYAIGAGAAPSRIRHALTTP